MNRPTWATVVGVIGIIIACFGILGSVQLIVMPKMMEMQQGMLSSIQTNIENQEMAMPQGKSPEEMSKAMEKLFTVPEWFNSYCLGLGLAALFVSVLYIIASINLLRTKPYAIKLFYTAASLAIVLALVKGAVLLYGTSFMLIAMAIGGVFSIVIHGILIIIVAVGNKDAFSVQEV
jgi:hypothetical protein